MKVARDIVVIGASAGGIEAVSALLSLLPSDIPAAFFLAQHVSPNRDSVLPSVLQRRTKLNVKYAANGEPIVNGTVFVAPPDKHLLVKKRKIALGEGPKENRARPAADVTFRSAAHAFEQRVVAVVLSGSSSDGTAGAQSVKRHGGIVVVQNPEEALFARMPLSVLDHVNVDYVSKLAEIATLLVALSTTSSQVAPQVHSISRFERAERGGPGLDAALNSVPSGLTCPACGGALWESTQNGISQYSCHIGHAFNADLMLEEYDEQLENVARVMLRLLDENVYLRKKLAAEARTAGHDDYAQQLEEKAAEYHQQVEALHKLIHIKLSDKSDLLMRRSSGL